MQPTNKSDWKARAAQAKKEGYLPGNPWEKMLQRHLERLFPLLVKELGPDLKPYCQTMTSEAMDLADKLENQGTDPETARELAMDRLLPKPPDEQENSEPWEVEGGEAALTDAAQQFLTQPQQKSQ